MAEFLPNSDDKEYEVISQDVKDIVSEHGFLETHGVLMITDNIQFKSCYNYAAPGRTYCKCGLILPGASDEVKKQVLKNVINCFNFLTTGATVFVKKNKNNWPQRKLPIVSHSA